MNYLFRPLTANDVEARVQSSDKNGFVLLIYKNARVDQNILDETVGVYGWQDKYEEFKGNLYCSIGIKSNEGEWIWKSNCGTESKTEAEKGEASDAFKRAGFNWGIGRELYTSPKVKIKGHVKEKDGKFFPEYYEYNVAELQVSDARKITALTITGKSMDGGYHEDTIFDWKDGRAAKVAESTPQAPQSAAPTAPQQSTSDMTLEMANNMEVPFGDDKGVRLEEASTSTLKYLANKAYKADLKQAAKMVLESRDRGDLPF